MAATQFNDVEDEALSYLPWRAQVLYLRGIRRFMNYNTGITGFPHSKIISTQSLREVCEVIPDRRSRESRKSLSRDEIKACVNMLIKAGLIERLPTSGLKNGYVFRCVLATLNKSVQVDSAPTAPRPQHPDETQQSRGIQADEHPNSTPPTAPHNRLQEKNINTHYAREDFISDDWRPSDQALERLKKAGHSVYDSAQLLKFISHHRIKKTLADANFDELFIGWIAGDAIKKQEKMLISEKNKKQNGGLDILEFIDEVGEYLED